MPGNSPRTVEVDLQHYFETIPNTMFTAFRCFTGECVNDKGPWSDHVRPWFLLPQCRFAQPSCRKTAVLPGHSITSVLADEFGVAFILGFVASGLDANQTWLVLEVLCQMECQVCGLKRILVSMPKTMRMRITWKILETYSRDL